MNKRIKELMDQAGIDVEAVENLGEMPTALKFAELLIRQCAIIGSRAQNDDNEIHDVYDVITSHYGVK